MKIKILGSGTCVPSLDRNPSAVLIQDGGRTILVDAGPGTMRQLLKAGTRIEEIDLLLLTHFHLDHSAELAALLFATKYPSFDRIKPLTVAGGTGLDGFYRDLDRAFGNTLAFPDGLLSLKELDLPALGPIRLHGFDLAWGPVVHAQESRAFRITGPGGFSLVCSGDTDYSPDLIDLARGADLMICEAALPDGQKVDGHLTPSLAGEIAAKAGVKKLVLTHFYPECEGVDMAAQCRKTYQGPLVLAEDLLDLR